MSGYRVPSETLRHAASQIYTSARDAQAGGGGLHQRAGGGMDWSENDQAGHHAQAQYSSLGQNAAHTSRSGHSSRSSSDKDINNSGKSSSRQSGVWGAGSAFEEVRKEDLPGGVGDMQPPPLEKRREGSWFGWGGGAGAEGAGRQKVD